MNVDFAPTFLDYAGLPTPGFMQGRSFRANLRGATPRDWRTAIFYHYWLQDQVKTNNPQDHIAPYPAQYGIRTKQFKLIFYYGLPLGLSHAPRTPSGWELYDLQSDPLERRNVYDDPRYAPTVLALKRQLLGLKAQVGDVDEKYPELLALRKATGGM